MFVAHADMCAFESSTQQAWSDLVPDLCSDSELVYAVEGGQNLHMALDHKARALVVLSMFFPLPYFLSSVLACSLFLFFLLFIAALHSLALADRRFQVGKIVLHRGQELRLGDAERA